jgi:hypothetical protein
MKSSLLVVGVLGLVLQGCASTLSTPHPQRLSLNETLSQAQPSKTTQSKVNNDTCPPLYGRVCYGPSDRPESMRCGCSTVSPLGTPYP